MCLVEKVKSNTVKKNGAQEPGMLGSRIEAKLDEVRQKMARVNTDILGISKLKWTEMGEFNSDDHCIYYCGQEPLRRNGTALIINKTV